MEDSKQLFEKESVGKALIKLSVPAVLVSIIGLVHHLIHSIYIAELDNTAMLSSTSLSLTLVTIITKIGEAVGIGASTYLGREMGAGKEDRSREIVRTSITLDVILTAILTAACFIILNPFLRWQANNNEEVLYYAIPYGAMALGTSVFTVFQTTMISLFRSVGDVKFPMYNMFFSTAATIILDPIFMFKFNMGILGAGVSSAVAGIISCWMCFHRLCKGKTQLFWKPFDFGISKTTAKEIFNVGISVYIRNFMSSFSISIYNNQVFKYSTAFAAGRNVGKNAMYFVNFFVGGIANGYLPLASYNYGAKKYHRLWKAILWNLEVQGGYCVIAISYISLFAESFISLFTKDPEAIIYGARYLRAYCYSLPIYSVYYIITSTLQAAGMGKQSMVLSISRQGLIYAPLLIILPKLFGEDGIFFSQPAADWLTVVVGILISTSLIREIYNGIKHPQIET